MHLLDRSSVPAPVCLTGYDYRVQTWDDIDRSCKRQVRLSIQRIQGQQIASEDADDEAEFIIGLRCAYCEGPIRHGGHLEHFRRKNRSHPNGYPELTFTWENLFLACDSKEHCGHYKDRKDAPLYDPDELIKPDIHDPDACLYFHSTGAVMVRNTHPGMTDEERRRASETVRVFNLDCGTLQGARFRAIKTYRDKTPGILEFLMECEVADREVFMRDEIEATRWEPYATTIKHFFEKAA
jgi:uncharacterized protein (TIGR02646 family)